MPEERSKRSSAVPYRLLSTGMNQFDAKRGTNRFDEDKNRKKKKKKMELKRLHVTRILNSFYTYPQKIQYKKKKKKRVLLGKNG